MRRALVTALALLALAQAACGKYAPPERTRPVATTATTELPEPDPDRDDEEPRP